MMRAYNQFSFSKIDLARGTEYRQKIKRFRVKYFYPVGKIINTERIVVMKLSEKYPHRGIFEKCLFEKTLVFHISNRIFYLLQAGETISIIQINKMDHKKRNKMEELMLMLSGFRHNYRPSVVEYWQMFIRRGILVKCISRRYIFLSGN